MALLTANTPRKRALTLAGLAACLALAALDGSAQESPTPITCTNPVSGTSWVILIDYRKQTVDSIPAKITPAGIAWFDPKDLSDYTLDRKSGDLTASVASSTGGYFRRARCMLGNPR